jgi:hypothetical protein
MFQLSPEEERIFSKLRSPVAIQDFLQTIPYNSEKKGQTCMSPRRVLQARTAHCIEGACLAAAVLWYHGERPLLLDLRSTSKDLDHVVALFKQNG